MRSVPLVGLLLLLIALTGSAPGFSFSPGLAGSRRMVSLKIHDYAGQTVVVSVAVGRAATISRPGAPTLRITPSVTPDGLLSLAGSAVSTSTGASPVVIDNAIAGPILLGGSARLELAGDSLDVAWVDDKTITDTFITTDDETSECCVVCEGIKTCACRVQAPCGACCDEACGGCGQIGSQARCADTVFRGSPGAPVASHRGSESYTASRATRHLLSW